MSKVLFDNTNQPKEDNNNPVEKLKSPYIVEIKIPANRAIKIPCSNENIAKNILARFHTKIKTEDLQITNQHQPQLQ